MRNTWVKTKDALPTKDGDYLTVSVYGKNREMKAYAVHSWANRLRDNSWDFDDDEYEHSGFYGHDPEWGAYEVPNIEAWMEIPSYEG